MARLPDTASWLALTGGVLYLAVGVLYLGSGLVMPYPWVLGMWALWMSGWVVLIGAFRTRRPWTLAVPVLWLGLWAVIVQLGSWLFGWTA